MNWKGFFRGVALSLGALFLCLLALFLVKIAIGPVRERTALELSGGRAVFGENVEGAGDYFVPKGGLSGKYISIGDEFPKEDAEIFAERGAALMLTVEPHSSESKNRSILDGIISGEYDPEIERIAEGAKGYPLPMLVRFGHEMNGNWYSWSGSANGKSPAKYVGAYRHFRDNFCKSADCTDGKILFVFSVNGEDVPREGWNSFENYYPGDGYVDFIGIDAFDWAEGGLFGRKEGKEILGKAYERAVRAFPEKPLLITEIATGRKEGRGEWTARLISSIGKDFQAVRGVFWFNIDKERAWALDSAQRELILGEISKEGGVLTANNSILFGGIGGAIG